MLHADDFFFRHLHEIIDKVTTELGEGMLIESSSLDEKVHAEQRLLVFLHSLARIR